MISYFNGDIHSESHHLGNKITLMPSKLIPTKTYEVAGDFSSASFLIVAGLIAKESNLMIKNVGLNPTRCGLISVLRSMGGENRNKK